MKRASLRALWRVAVASMLAVFILAADAQAQGGPKLIHAEPQPVYPPVARDAAIGGEVSFVARVRADGTVEGVVILKAPASNLGFEAAVEDAVKQWRFEPIVTPAEGTTTEYTGSINFQTAIPREWVYPMSSRIAWMHVRDLVKELKLSADWESDPQQILVTKWRSFRGGALRDLHLDLPQTHQPLAVQFHVYVVPGIEPARIAVGSIIESMFVAGGRRAPFTTYGDEGASAWFISKLTERTGTKPERLAASAEFRATQARRLMPANVDDRCSVRAAKLVPSSEWKRPGVTPARLLREIKPVYPKTEQDARRESEILFEAEITEHGTVVSPQHLKPADATEDFKRASQLAVTLWRFQPALIEGCAVRSRATFAIKFTLK